jgi:hypothetical protein
MHPLMVKPEIHTLYCGFWLAYLPQKTGTIASQLLTELFLASAAVWNVLEQTLGRAYRNEMAAAEPAAASVQPGTQTQPGRLANESTWRRPRGTVRRPRQRQRVSAIMARMAAESTVLGEAGPVEDALTPSSATTSFLGVVSMSRPPPNAEGGGNLVSVGRGVQGAADAESPVCA